NLAQRLVRTLSQFPIETIPGLLRVAEPRRLQPPPRHYCQRADKHTPFAAPLPSIQEEECRPRPERGATPSQWAKWAQSAAAATTMERPAKLRHQEPSLQYCKAIGPRPRTDEQPQAPRQYAATATPQCPGWRYLE